MSDDKSAKLKALKLTLDKLDKTYGKGAVMRMGDAAIEQIATIPSGSLGLDLALGVSGYPRGRIVEIYGPESSGKTTLTLHAIAEVQKQVKDGCSQASTVQGARGARHTSYTCLYVHRVLRVTFALCCRRD